jgi:amidase
MSQTEAHYTELLEISKRIQSRQISSVEATQAQLARIAQLDPSLKSYATVMADHALADAQAADKAIGAGQIKGPLHGVPIAVKDLCWTAGTKTAAGMTIHANNIPTEDGTVVRKLREAGAVILGKLQLTEGAYADHHPNITPPVNPLGCGAVAGCIFKRFRRGHRRWPVLWLVGFGHRRLDPFSMCRQWHHRHQTHVGAGQPIWRV